MCRSGGAGQVREIRWKLQRLRMVFDVRGMRVECDIEPKEHTLTHSAFLILSLPSTASPPKYQLTLLFLPYPIRLATTLTHKQYHLTFHPTSSSSLNLNMGWAGNIAFKLPSRWCLLSPPQIDQGNPPYLDWISEIVPEKWRAATGDMPPHPLPQNTIARRTHQQGQEVVGWGLWVVM